MPNTDGFLDGAQPEPTEKPAPTITKRGRPAAFDPDIADELCELISESDLSVRKIVESRKNFPSRSTINRWLGEYPNFRMAYYIAMFGRVEDMAFDCIAIADDSSHDHVLSGMDGEDGTPHVIEDKETLSRSKLRIDERHYMMGKLAPKNFGEGEDHRSMIEAVAMPRLAAKVAGNGDDAIEINGTVIEDHPIAQSFEAWQRGHTK